ncbi:MAG: allophycocyanin subunit beta [Symploca sp. SIO2G7]|nr:allophycocyanin subunit beta [Symploca sp. SIO2G7]
MQDLITSLINPADIQGQYLDDTAMEQLKNYYQSGTVRLKAVKTIKDNPAKIITQTVAKSLLYGDVTLPGGNMYPTRRYAACLRDLDYFLRYATYAMLAADTSLLDEQVLNGLKDTYLSLGVPLATTVDAIQAMKDVITDMVGQEAGAEMGIYLDHIAGALK